jgi:hypothetical protein
MIVLAALKRYGVPETLDEWLRLNFAGLDMTEFVFDAEIFDYLPEQFHEEFIDRFSNYVPKPSERGYDDAPF